MKKKITLFAGSLIFSASLLVAQPTIDDPFFTKVSYIGAMQDYDWTEGWCNWNCQYTNYPAATVEVKDSIVGSVTWTNDKVYLLKGFVYVVDGATLTIQEGTIIRGDKTTMGSLIVERGGKVFARGTKEKPIVMTSNQPAGLRAWSDWGGLVICGKAKINKGEEQIEGGPRSKYGGNDDDDNSGVYQYIRIEFPGYPFQPDKEINGLTLGGVGRGTTIDHIFVAYSGDDSFEWFGGTVNCKYLVAYRGQDDDFDTDYGYSGMVQFGIALRDPQKADKSGSNGFESDNDGSGTTNEPITKAIFSNISVYGPRYNDTVMTSFDANFRRGHHIRRNSSLSSMNNIICGWPTGLFVDGFRSRCNWDTTKTLHIQYDILAGMIKNFEVNNDSTTSGFNWAKYVSVWNDASNHNLPLASSVNYPALVDPFNLAQPDFRLKPSSPARNKSYWAVKGDTVAEPKPVVVGLKKYIGNELSLSAYPNPAQGECNIHISVSTAGVLSVKVYDITGMEVADLFNQKVVAGDYKVLFVAPKSGMFFVKAYLNGSMQVIKVIAQ